ncbi:MAG: prepilin-type N-terminal cleavage/methylation domain-containing protein [Planctomycetes bacterium]|nr:prepilin-type N-terminal cleavage/methylation domain-containing protein [Planctomycetota bacterium]MBL7008480.1 prepilin-type N-terminal cleavage/methylation domain-containing protein [Planctomycetota bacterium]
MLIVRTLRGAARAGFTLLEMMVVIIIIGILSTYLIVNVPEWMDKANQSACEINMRNAYRYMVSWQMDHEGALPRDSGQKFWLRLWKDDQFEHSESHAKMFFCPNATYQDHVDPEEFPMGVMEYLDLWDELPEGGLSYAGFDAGGDRAVRAQLKNSPAATAIMSDAFWTHRTGMIYMTADGVQHRLLRSELEEEYGINVDEVEFMPGPGCEVEILTTVSSN